MPPSVSVIVPCYNEEGTIYQLLEALHLQSYPLESLEVVVADGLSEDGTLDRIESFRADHPDLKVQVVSNASRTIPSALNCAIRSSQGEIIVRMDAHSRPYPEYVSRCVGALQAGLGANVGGLWKIVPGSETWVARSIAAAAAHPLGVGDARYRIGAQASEVDTVPFGAFRKELVNEIGMFDEKLLTNEDYEFNARVRLSGRKIWLDPEILSMYMARTTYLELARQYWRYGFWKFRMLRRYPGTLRWRQALPPLLVLSLLGSLILVWVPVARLVLALEVCLYLSVLLVAGLDTAFRGRDAAFLLGVPVAIGTMHLAWGAGFLWSVIACGSGSGTHG